MVSLGELNEVFELAQKSTDDNPYPISDELATFILDNDLAKRADVKCRNDKTIITITSSNGAILICERERIFHGHRSRSKRKADE